MKKALSGVNADEPVEKFFGRARMRCGGNFYIDIVDVNAAARVVNLHALVQNDVMPLEINENHCVTCAEPVSFEETYCISEFTIDCTQSLLDSEDSLKHKVVYIAGHLVFKYGDPSIEEELLYATEFIENLSRGGLKVPSLSVTFFVHSAMKIHENLGTMKARCRTYMKKCFSYISSPLAKNSAACQTLANILLKAHVRDNSDRERELGCLRRKEKLSSKTS